MRGFYLFVLVVLSYLFTACTQSAEVPLAPQAISTDKADVAYDVAARNRVVVVAGTTAGSLHRTNPSRVYDAFIRRYAPLLSWGKQFGSTSSPDYGYDITLDSLGHSYIAGETPSTMNPNKRVVYLRKYAPDGTLLWTRQFGLGNHNTEGDVTVDKDDNVYLTTFDFSTITSRYLGSFVYKLSPAGQVLLTIRLQSPVTGSSPPQARALAVDSQGSIYVLADFVYTLGGIVPRDTYLFRYNASGSLTGSKRIALASSLSLETGLTLDLELDQADNVVLSVSTERVFGYVIKYQGTDLSRLWLRKLTTTSIATNIYSVATDGTDIYITGAVSGKFPGTTSSGVADAFVMKYSAEGSRQWVTQFGSTAINDPLGTNGIDVALGVAVSDAVYVVGSTTGKLLSSTPKPKRDEDAFFAQLNKTTGAINWLDQ